MEFGIFVIIVQLGWLLVRVGETREILYRIYKMQKEANAPTRKK
jgi:hypothetical protein